MSIFDEVTKRLEIKSLTTHRDLAVGVPKQCVEMGVGILRALATSLTIEPDDFDCAQVSPRGRFA